MKCLRFAMLGAAAVLIAGAGAARADVITSELNCPVVGGQPCNSPTGSYGTVTFSDVAGGGVSIGLMLTAGTTVQGIYFNYTGDSTVTPISATINGTSVSVLNDPNNVTLLGSGGYGLFDVKIPDNGTITQAGSNFTVLLDTSLTATTIVNSLDTNNLFDFAVHLQNCGSTSGGICEPGQVGNDSLAVAELPGSNNVPEPGTLALLGFGILGVGLSRRRR